MSNILKTAVVATLALAAPKALLAQATTIFSDDFGNGSTINGVSDPTADSTSYDFGSSKTGVETITSGVLNFDLSSATSSGFIEAQALFTTSPVTLATPGDYIDLTYTFTDNGTLLAGGTSSAIYTGLYNSGGNVPVSIAGGGSGNAVTFNATAGSSVATGNAAYWQGYVSRIGANGGNSESYTRPQQTGAGTTSANQELIGNNFGTGAFNNPTGTQVGGNLASTVTLAAGQYTVDYRLTLSSASTLTISDNLYSGVGTGGTDLSSQSTVTSSALLTTSFDGLAIGDRNAPTTSENPDMALNQITVSAEVQTVVPEPNSLALLGGGLAMLRLAWRRRPARA